MFGADIRKISHLITQSPDITICNNTAILKHQMSLVSCWKGFTNDPFCGWWHQGGPSSTLSVSHLQTRAQVLAQPQQQHEILPSCLLIFLWNKYIPAKSHTQTPSAYQDSLTCLWQLQYKPPKCFLLCWYSRWTLPPATICRIRQHSQAKMLSTWFISPSDLGRENNFLKLGSCFRAS